MKKTSSREKDMQKQENVKKENNIRIFAVNREDESGFNIYMDFSGEQCFLIAHRHNAMLWVLLKDGISLARLRRWRVKETSEVRRYFGRLSERQINNMENAVSHLRKVIDSYLADYDYQTLEYAGGYEVSGSLDVDTGMLALVPADVA